MKLSIVTVVLNDKDGFVRTAKNIAGILTDDFEWIVIDGVSTDNTIGAIKEYSKYISEYISEVDSGIYYAMNKGIKLCSGNYIIFMNAGDTFSSNITLEFINKHIFQDGKLDVILCGTLQSFGGINIYRPPKRMSWIKKGLPAFHQSTFYRTSLLKERGFNVDYKLLADYELLAYMATNGVTVAYVDFPVSIYSVGGSSYTQYGVKFKDLFNIKRDVLNMPFLDAYLSAFIRMVSSVAASLLNRYSKYLKCSYLNNSKSTTATKSIQKESYKYKS